MEKLYWLNRHYIKQAPAERIEQLALPFFSQAGYLPAAPSAGVAQWFSKVIALLAPSVNKLDELPARTQLIFHVDPVAALSAADNAEVLALPKANDVLSEFLQKIEADNDAMTPERFKAIVNEVKEKTGAKGKELFHPIRIVITGSHSGPEFDKLIPILEEGSQLDLPTHVMNVRERVQAFRAAWAKQ